MARPKKYGRGRGRGGPQAQQQQRDTADPNAQFRRACVKDIQMGTIGDSGAMRKTRKTRQQARTVVSVPMPQTMATARITVSLVPQQHHDSD
jgi:hypothetical protein